MNLETLFEAGEPEEDAEGGGGFSAEEGPSKGFLALVGKTKEKLEKRKVKPKTMAAAVFNRARAEVDKMLRSGDWDGAGARHLVALYDRMHERCYGFEPAELGPTERFNAGMLAGSMLKARFDGDIELMVNFVLWVWDREIGREKWRREEKKSGGRIGVRLMFSGSLYSDWRADLARTGKRA